MRTRYGIKNLALIDFSGVQSDAIHRDRRRSHTIERCRRRSMRANTGDRLIALQDFSSVLTDAIDDVRTLSTAVDGISENLYPEI